MLSLVLCHFSGENTGMFIIFCDSIVVGKTLQKLKSVCGDLKL